LVRQSGWHANNEERMRQNGKNSAGTWQTLKIDFSAASVSYVL